MSNRYMELTDRQRAERDKFPLAAAFSDEQFKSEMERLGVSDKSELVSIGFGAFCRKTDAPRWVEMTERHAREIADEIAKDTTGDGFVKDMFRYELDNHEFGYTRDYTDAVAALGYTLQEIADSSVLSHGFAEAMREAIEWDDAHA